MGTTLEVLPQQEFTYVINIPEDHEPGLHWVHPHHHGSSTLQLVGGAALALIVKDPEDGADSSLPAEVLEADERVIVFQDWISVKHSRQLDMPATIFSPKVSLTSKQVNRSDNDSSPSMASTNQSPKSKRVSGNAGEFCTQVGKIFLLSLDSQLTKETLLNANSI